jgi:ubiquinone/menaquinone biosynthesis C-methylase UbiE
MNQPTSNPGYVDTKLSYLQSILQLLGHVKPRSYNLMGVQTGHTVLDVGCGPATDTIPLARIVGPTGQVIGVDSDAEMITAANQTAQQAGVLAWVRHQQANAATLPFAANCFDSCRCDRVLQNVSDPEKVLAEMVRVTKPDGWIVLADPDWSSLSIDTALLDIEWKLRRFRADMRVNGYSGRQLYRQCKRRGLQDILYEAYPIFMTDYAQAYYFGVAERVEREALEKGIITHDELQRWHEEQEQADKAGVYFTYINLVMVAGRKSTSDGRQVGPTPKSQHEQTSPGHRRP